MPSPTTLRRLFGGFTFAAAALLGACGGDSGGPTDPGPLPDPNPGPQAPVPGPSSSIEGRAIFGLTCANQLVLFGSGNPGTLARQVQISGMPAGAAMLGIDFRGGALYGVGSDSRVYTIDTLSGSASPVGGAFVPAAEGEHFGLAYDEANDRLRLSGVESNQNLGLDPSSGAAGAAGAELAYGASDEHAETDPGLAAEAYHAGTLYGIETNANALVTVSAATGELATVANLPFNVYICSGMDVDADGTAYAALATDGGSELFTINLTTGATSFLGGIPGSPVHSIAVRP